VEKLNFISTRTLIESNKVTSNRSNRKGNKQTKNQNITTGEKATMLIETLKGDINWLQWYCKVVNQLPEATIQIILEGARYASCPDKYFAKAAANEMRKLNK